MPRVWKNGDKVREVPATVPKTAAPAVSGKTADKKPGEEAKSGSTAPAT
jgi:hypothetical protein